MRVGVNSATAAYLGSTAISTIYLGALQVFSAVGPPSAQPDGYDIFLFYADSLGNKGGTYDVDNIANGNAPPPPVVRLADDIDRAGAYQFTGPDASVQGIISSDITPVWGNHGDALDRIKLAEPFARAWLDEVGSPNRRSLVAVMGRSGQAILVGPANLAFGGTRYVEAIPQFNGALIAARSEFPASRIRGIILSLGSNDANAVDTLDGVAFEAALSAVCTNLRLDVTEASEAPIVFYGPVPAGGGDFNTVRTAQANLASSLPNTAILNIQGQVWDDSLHGDAEDEKASAGPLAVLLKSMPEPQRPRPFSIPNQIDVAPDTDITSAAVLVPMNGVGVAGTITVTGGLVSLNDGAFLSTPQVAQWSDQMRVRRRSSPDGSTALSATVRVTGPTGAFVEASFTVTTIGVGTNRVVFGSGKGILTNGSVVFGSAPGIKETA